MRNGSFCFGFAFLTFLLVFVATPVPVRAAELPISNGCLIRTTPFFHRLLGAGLFNPVSKPFMTSDKKMPVQMLFRMARAFRYTSDKKKSDKWQSASETSKSYRGDCEDKAIWLYSRMRQDGHRDASFVIGRYGPHSAEFHCWVTYVNEDGKAILLDPTIQRKPWEINTFPEKLYRPMHILKNEDCVSL